MASFHWAAQVGATKSFKLLLSHGADKTAKDINGRFVPWCEVKESKSIGKGYPLSLYILILIPSVHLMWYEVLC